MTITSYQQAVKYLESFIGKIIFKVDKEFVKKHDPLERMRILLSLLGNPQEKFKSVLVGGTSGKGSTSYLISHILTKAGYKTGLTLSPHLQKVNERLQINGKSISDQKFTDLLNSILSSIEGMKRMKVGAPSYFEILVAMSFLYFSKEKVDIAVVEVGMGGEFDATNTLNPLVAVLTNVGLDHTNILGKTVEKIAGTKAGVIKKLEMRNEKLEIGRENNSHLSSFISHLVVVSGVKQASVIKIVKGKCKKVGAKLFRLGKDFDYKIKKVSHEGSVFDLTIDNDRVLQLNDLNISLLGEYQVENASLAIEVVLNLKKFGLEVSENVIRKSLSTAFFPGRFEVFGGPVATPLIVLDGAHNPTKMKAFIYSLKKLYPKERPTSPKLRGASKIFLVGFKFDKDIPKMLKEILRVADEIIVTEFKAKTDMSAYASADALDIKNQILKIKNTIKVYVEKDSKKALKMGLKTIQQYSNSAIIVVTGSLYLVGEIRDLIMSSRKD